MSLSNTNTNECPICMECINNDTNRVTTECGHEFHCSCLMHNVAVNGFGCPYCRTVMADEPEDDYSDSEYDDDASLDDEELEDHTMTSFRMFHQRINGEEIEEEDSEDEDERVIVPDSRYIVQELIRKGITMDDLVKKILYEEYSDRGSQYTIYGAKPDEVYDKLDAIMSEYNSENDPFLYAPVPVVNP
jgi:hypothetical protein